MVKPKRSRSVARFPAVLQQALNLGELHFFLPNTVIWTLSQKEPLRGQEKPPSSSLRPSVVNRHEKATANHRKTS